MRDTCPPRRRAAAPRGFAALCAAASAAAGSVRAVEPTGGSGGAAAAPPQWAGVTVQNARYAGVRGFSYHPSWADSCVNAWGIAEDEFRDRIRSDLTVGKRLFPRIDTIRVILCLDAHVTNHTRFVRNFDAMLSAGRAVGVRFILTLFNAWFSFPNWGGQSDYQVQSYPFNASCPVGYAYVFSNCVYVNYLRELVLPHADDDAVLVWDVMNEPEASHTRFVVDVFAYIKRELRPTQPVSVSCNYLGPRDANSSDPATACGDWFYANADVVLMHPYWQTVWTNVVTPSGGRYEQAGYDKMISYIDGVVGRANQAGKPVIACEGCWGSNDDAERARTCDIEMRELSVRGIGIGGPHAMLWSPAADCHGPRDGYQTNAANMAFANRNGTLRAHHEFFNKY